MRHSVFYKKTVLFLAISLMTFFFLYPTTAVSQDPKNTKTIRMISTPWPPYFGPNLPKNGFFCEIVRLAFHEMGYQFNVRFTDWVTAKSLSQKGEYDGLLGGYYKKNRTNHYIYSLPVISATSIFIARKTADALYNGDLKNLKNLRIGMSKGYTYTGEFDNATYLNKISASGPKELIHLILNQKVDVILISEQVARYYLLERSTTERQQLITLGPSLTHNKIYVLVSKKNPDHLKIVSDFNQGIKKLVFSGKMSALLP